MEKEFIPYEQAVALKELGFDEPCFGAYIGNELRVFEFSNDLKGYAHDANLVIGAPTFSQAFRWFRVKYNIDSHIKNKRHQSNLYQRWDGYEAIIESEDDFFDVGTFNTYPEAELACLNKLIEIIKTKSI